METIVIDPKLFRDAPERLRETCRLKNVDVDIDAGITLDNRRREIIGELESLQGERNQASKAIGEKKQAGENANTEIAQVKTIGERIKTLTAERSEAENALRDVTLAIPNHPNADVPVGNGADDNVTIDAWGERTTFDFTPKPHWDLVTALDIVDFPRGTKLSGSGFILYKGLGAKLERALIQYFLDLHTEQHGYTEWFTPILVNRDCMIGTGQLPKMEDDMYRVDQGDDLFLIPTAEVPVTNIHRDEIIAERDLPLRYTAYTPCFRREAGAAGKDTRGLLRLHQFNKVELVNFTTPENSYAEMERLRGSVATVLQNLGLSYRVLNLCTGDISFAAAKCYDFEVWAAGCEQWLEVSSCSNFEDFQARRAGIRVRGADKKVRPLHTLNASALALPRTMVAIIENYQQADGSIEIPEVLRPYFNGREQIA